MTDLLNRSEAPLTDEQWELLDRAVETTAKRNMVGRRVLNLYGPLGTGAQVIDFKTYAGDFKAVTDLTGEGDEGLLQVPEKVYRQIPLIYKDFRIDWRDLETVNNFGLPLDTTPAAMSALFVAEAEDDLIFNGNPELGIDGLLTVPGRSTLTLTGDWSEEGSAYEDVVKAIEVLAAKGFHDPYALVVSPQLYAKLIRAYKNTNYLELDLIKKVVTDGVYKTPAIKGAKGVLLATGAEYMDLAVALDLSLVFVETAQMHHYFRVMEMVVPRIMVPAALCTLESA